MPDQYDILIRKLDEFIRKYYKNQLIRGAIYSVGALLSFFLILTLFEHFAWLPAAGRAVLFYAYLLSAVYILGRWVFGPLARLFRLGRQISHEQAATIIGKHFTEVRDKLLNVLQLRNLEAGGVTSKVLIEASINQKISELRPIPFRAAIDLRANRRYLKYALGPLTVMALLLVASPTLVREPARRLVQYNAHFEKELPYQIRVLNDGLDAVQQEDFLLEVGIEGEEVPDVVFVEANGGRYRMVKDHPAAFHYLFRNLQSDVRFRIATEKVSTIEYTLRVLPRPMILSFDVTLDYRPG